MHNRKLIISGMILANCGIFILPAIFFIIASLIGIIHFIKYREWLFSGLIILTAIISGIMGFLLNAVQINWLDLANSTYNLDNLQFGSVFVVVPLFINLLFIYSFDEVPNKHKII